MKATIRYALGLVSAAVMLYTVSAMTSCGGDKNGPMKHNGDELCDQYHVSQVQHKAVNPNPVFAGTELIHVPAYPWEGGNSLRGDDLYAKDFSAALDAATCCGVARTLDVVSTEPVLQWQTSNDSLVAVAIFKSRVNVDFHGTHIDDNTLASAVWAWHSKLPGGSRNGDLIQVTYGEGRAVAGGTILEDSVPAPLQGNTAYAWAVWAWDQEGTKVVRSSREILFMTEGVTSQKKLKYGEENFVIGTWNNTKRFVDAGEIKTITFTVDKCRYTLGTDPTVIETAWQVDPISDYVQLQDGPIELFSSAWLDCLTLQLEYMSSSGMFISDFAFSK